MMNDRMIETVLRELINRIRLPPQLKLRYAGTPSDWDGHDLYVTGTWPDVRDPTKTIQTFFPVRIDSILVEQHPEELPRLILNHVTELWLHELHEWFTYNGEHVIEPTHGGSNG